MSLVNVGTLVVCVAPVVSPASNTAPVASTLRERRTNVADWNLTLDVTTLSSFWLQLSCSLTALIRGVNVENKSGSLGRSCRPLERTPKVSCGTRPGSSPAQQSSGRSTSCEWPPTYHNPLGRCK